ncbi:GTPase HflX [Caldisalinibacter kiritimatiensis]|uniref:GTPase HflX n=1 Tax=Caldisalinibacter kiritimatiensis TaxID=1304284 RepID=R1AVL3_9FIRM|nr:GTPase HflX [Caldisalinibacter kiritimatiensis]EOD00702.1 GTP-binding protein HflX [Caldisalinibacter kiritimatiensis]
MLTDIKNNKKERVLLVGVDTKKINDFNIKSSIEELKELALAAETEVVECIIQKRDSIDPRLYIGKGKATEIARYCDELDVDTVVFNDELSGAQLRNLEEVIDRKIIDRTNLILDIFAKRATSKEGKLQVELAQLKYRLPRLIGLGNQLSRTGGGIGTRGPGEKKLEIDRRHILKRISEIEKQLQGLEEVRETKRKKRQGSSLPIVALVGYTNAGKSTLLNTLISKDETYTKEKEVFAYDMLFATLDTTLRRGTLPNGQNFLITDTVGFVSKLPTHLIEAFKGTLEEVKYADLILHVVDITNEDLDIQVKTTLEILKDLEVLNKPIITVFNKVDKGHIDEIHYKIDGTKVYISAKEGKNIDLLFKMIEENIPDKFYDVKLLIPYDNSKISSYLFDNTKVVKFEYRDNGTLIETILNEIDYKKYSEYIVD